MHLTVIGTGYVGLVAGVGFADFGNEVTCVDIDTKRIEKLTRGELPIYEPGLAEILARTTKRGRLRFSSDTRTAVAGAEIVFIAVGTPSSEDGSADLAHVLNASRSIAEALTGPCVVVTKSTVPVGAGDHIAAVFDEFCTHDVTVVSNPEFLKEGDALNDFMKPARVLIGCDDEAARCLLRRLYSPFVMTNDRIHFMDRRSAELTKYAANAMLATRISFMNELSELASVLGADIENVRRGLGSDPRIGNKFLFAGAGFGGSCFPKDIRALLRTASDLDVPLGIVNATQEANQRQKRVLARLVLNHFGSISGKRIALWGLAFKPKTDDVRESPAIEVARQLAAAGATVCAYDPEANDNSRSELADSVLYAKDMYTAAEGADALVLATEWPTFRRPDFYRLAAIMRGTAIFDGRNIWNPTELRAQGFTYYGIGRPPGK